MANVYSGHDGAIKLADSGDSLSSTAIRANFATLRAVSISIAILNLRLLYTNCLSS